MTLESIDPIEEPPPFRQNLLLLLSFWLLPFWCFANAAADVLALVHPLWRLELTVFICVSSYIGLLSWMLSTLRQSDITQYSFTGYYWIMWMVVVIFAPGLDNLYYAAYDWQVSTFPDNTLMPTVIYGGIYYLLPACSLLLFGQIGWEYYASYNIYDDWASILVENTTCVAALLTWDSSLADSQWLILTMSGYLYYLLPKTQRDNLFRKFQNSHLPLHYKKNKSIS